MQRSSFCRRNSTAARSTLTRGTIQDQNPESKTTAGSVRPTRGNQIDKSLVYASVVGELGVEGCSHRSSLPDRDGDIVFAFGGDYFDAFAEPLNLGGADENHFERRAAWLLWQESAFADGALELASVGVATDADIDCAQAGLLRVFHFAR